MAQEIKQVRAFIASPGGLDDERKAARAAADEVNELVGKHVGYRVEMYGWEDTISGAGRAQSIINAEMDLCEIFIGMIWRKWGTKPDVDGRFTSGFEEEFTLSFEKNQSLSWPSIHMFFKEIDPTQESDPGPDLQRVINFRQRLQEDKKILYQNFSSAEQFGQEVRKILSSFVMGKYHEEVESKKEVGRMSGAKGLVRKAGDLDVVESDASFSFIDKALVALKAGNYPQMTSLEASRLRLVGLLSEQSSNDTVRIDVHDSNIIYRNRNKLRLSKPEKEFLVASALYKFSAEIMPIWSWLFELRKVNKNYIADLTIRGQEEEIQSSFEVCRFLGMKRENFIGLDSDFVKKHWLADGRGADAKEAAIRFLGDFGATEDVGALEDEERKSDPQTSPLATAAIIKILLRESELAGVGRLLKSSVEKLDDATIASVTDCFSKINSSELKAALDHRIWQIRNESLKILASRGDASDDLLKRALDDPSRNVRLTALLLLDEIGIKTTLKSASEVLRPERTGLTSGFLFRNDRTLNTHLDKFRVSKFDQLDIDELAEIAESSEPVRDDAWLKLIERTFAKSGGELRAKFDKRFEDDINTDGVSSARELGAANALLGLSPTVAKRRKLMRGALAILAARENPADLARIRSAVAEDPLLLTEDAIRFLIKFGSNIDAEILCRSISLNLSALRRDSDISLRSVARTILGLCDDPIDLFGQSEIVLGIKALLIEEMNSHEFSNLDFDFRVSLMDEDNDRLRKATALKIVQLETKSTIRKFSAALLDKGTYFYNAVIWLDLGIAFSRAEAKKIAERVTS